MTDQQRADHLGCYGNTIVKTPKIDSIASRGTRFENFYVSNPLCQPNRAALVTGQMPSVNGCRQNGIPLGRDQTTYADVLRAAGYRTGLVGKAHFQNVSPILAPPQSYGGLGQEPPGPFGLAQRSQRRGSEYQCEIRTLWIEDPEREIPLPYYGFEQVRLCIGHGDQVEGHYTRWLRNHLAGEADPRGRNQSLDDDSAGLPQIWRTALPEALYPTTFVGESACQFLEDTGKEPFLLVASFPDPHHPFTPPGRYYDMYDPNIIPLPPSYHSPTRERTDIPEYIHRVYEIGAQQPNAYWPFHTNEDTVRRMIALNYGTISMVDDWVGNILQTLEKTGLAQNTIVIFMSDHGDYLGDHGTVLKHGLHSHGLISVPLVWFDPTCSQPATTSIQGSAIDFAPTLLQRAGIRIPVGMQGRDLLAEDSGNLPVLIEDAGLSMVSLGQPTASSTLIHEGWRLSMFEGFDGGELYDLSSDQFELRNRWSDPATIDRKYFMMQMLIERQIALSSRSLVPTHQA